MVGPLALFTQLLLTFYHTYLKVEAALDNKWQAVINGPTFLFFFTIVTLIILLSIKGMNHVRFNH